MTEHIVKILESGYISHDVKRFMVEKPPGFSFIPGQATDVSINHPDWKEKLRPFTFTSLNEWPNLEFIIKIYVEHMVKQMPVQSLYCMMYLELFNIKSRVYLLPVAPELHHSLPYSGLCMK